MSLAAASAGAREFGWGTLIAAFPAGDYTFAFNVGLSDADSVVVSHVDPPDVASGFPTDISPSGPDVPLNVDSVTWNCPSCSGDAFRINLFDLGTDDSLLVGFVFGASSSSFPIPPGILDPATSYELNVSLVDFLFSEAVSIGDGTTLYSDQFVSENGTTFSTVPEPSTAFLLAAGLCCLAPLRRHAHRQCIAARALHAPATGPIPSEPLARRRSPDRRS